MSWGWGPGAQALGRDWSPATRWDTLERSSRRTPAKARFRTFSVVATRSSPHFRHSRASGADPKQTADFKRSARKRQRTDRPFADSHSSPVLPLLLGWGGRRHPAASAASAGSQRLWHCLSRAVLSTCARPAWAEVLSPVVHHSSRVRPG